MKCIELYKNVYNWHLIVETFALTLILTEIEREISARRQYIKDEIKRCQL